MPIRDDPEPPEDFALDQATLAYIVVKAKAFDALVGSDDANDASDAADDRFVDALEDERDNPLQRELAAAIRGLDEDAKATLVALALGPSCAATRAAAAASRSATTSSSTKSKSTAVVAA